MRIIDTLFPRNTIKMKDIKKELIEVRNRIDDIIKQLGIEENISISEVPLENIIFCPRLFNTSEKVTKLKRTIGSFISENPTKDEMKVDASAKNQYFYLYAALWSLPNVLADDSMVNFIRQMALWFPEHILSGKKVQRNYELSLSHEKKKWEKENQLLKVTQWKTFIKESSMSVKKATYFESLAMKIYTTINVLLKGMLKENH